jgi:hypothetical protein
MALVPKDAHIYTVVVRRPFFNTSFEGRQKMVLSFKGQDLAFLTQLTIQYTEKQFYRSLHCCVVENLIAAIEHRQGQMEMT